MIFISHRGNLNGKNLLLENSLDYILNAINTEYYLDFKPYLVIFIKNDLNFNCYNF